MFCHSNPGILLQPSALYQNFLSLDKRPQCRFLQISGLPKFPNTLTSNTPNFAYVNFALPKIIPRIASKETFCPIHFWHSPSLTSFAYRISYHEKYCNNTWLAWKTLNSINGGHMYDTIFYFKDCSKNTCQWQHYVPTWQILEKVILLSEILAFNDGSPYSNFYYAFLCHAVV